ncbi:hypothetical protein BpHYR1_031469 [Brachionus plicatilis]|uniref:Uncharacterized protein n=1 Tax=Brachionus plicatilis TaxID=10195 RepID=A0A3M7RLK2_BRAPC|nr:hypothetical protein BpHYR1_031469 [Brachionus plicatilis]
MLELDGGSPVWLPMEAAAKEGSWPPEEFQCRMDCSSLASRELLKFLGEPYWLERMKSVLRGAEEDAYMGALCSDAIKLAFGMLGCMWWPICWLELRCIGWPLDELGLIKCWAKLLWYGAGLLDDNWPGLSECFMPLLKWFDIKLFMLGLEIFAFRNKKFILDSLLSFQFLFFKKNQRIFILKIPELIELLLVRSW